MEIEDYDYFAIQRQKRLDEIDGNRKEKAWASRERSKAQRLSWRGGGQQVMQGLRKGVLGVRSMLQPHHDWRINSAHFLSVVELARATTWARAEGPLWGLLCEPARVLRQSQPQRHQRFLHKSNLIEWKFAVMAEVRAVYRARHGVRMDAVARAQAQGQEQRQGQGVEEQSPEAQEQTQTQEQRQYEAQGAWVRVPHELRVLRHLHRLYSQQLPIPRKVTSDLKDKRALYRVALAKLELIQETQQACEAIAHCTSRQHTNPLGCSNCGVRWIGGMLDRVAYVQSLDRETRLPTLVTLAFEKESLVRESLDQLVVVARVGGVLKVLEKEVCDGVRVNVQAWWVVVLAFKRTKRRHQRLVKWDSTFKRKRMVEMKHEVDRQIPQPQELDMPDLLERYCDVAPALREYVLQQQMLKAQRLHKWGQVLLQWVQRHAGANRAAAREEALRLAALPKPPRPIVFKDFNPREKKVFVCYRLECKMRSFLTSERHAIHAHMHLQYDAVRYAREEENRAAKAVRGEREKRVMVRVRASMRRLAEGGEGDGEGGEGEEGEEEGGDGERKGEESVAGEQRQEVGQKVEQKEGQEGVREAEEGEEGGKEGEGGRHEWQPRPFAQLKNPTASPPSSAISAPASASAFLVAGLAQGSFASSASTGMGVGVGAGMSLGTGGKGGKGVSSHSQSHQRLVQSLQKHSHEDEELRAQIASSVRQFSQMAHIHVIHSLFNTYLYSLEMVSQQGDIKVARRIPLDRPLVRIGTHSSCECVVTLTGAARREGKIAAVHCLFYCPMSSGAPPNPSLSSLPSLPSLSLGPLASTPATQELGEEEGIGEEEGGGGGAGEELVKLVDNSTLWGTYVVSSQGARRAPVKLTAGVALTPGLLVCIGVLPDGPAEISPTQGTGACIVYRVRCLEQEIV